MENQCSSEISQEYLLEVAGILYNQEFLSLGKYTHHQNTTRLLHSMNVSYMAWKLAKYFGCDEKAAARAGLLHDFCPYDFKEDTPTGEHQAFYHPKAAAENSSRYFDLTEREMEAILTHMFPLGPMPRNKEAWVITLADKVCAVMERCHIDAAMMKRNRRMVLSKAA